MKKFLTLVLFVSLGLFLNAQTRPTASNNTVTTLEDNDYVFVAGDFGYNDADGDPMDHIQITQLESVGTLYYDANGDNIIDAGEDVTLNQIINTADIPRLKFRPNPDENGAGYDQFRFLVNDGKDGDSFSTYRMTIDVTPVNDEPSFTPGGNQTVLEDAGAQTVNNWATAISEGPADESGQTLTFHVSNNNNGLFSVQPDVDAATGDLTYTPAANQNGTATVTVYITDDGGTANGGDDTSPSINFTITVTAVNDPPTGADNTVTLYENSNITFATGHFGYADVEGDAFDHIEVTTAPGLGTLWIDSDGDGTVNGAEVALNSSDVVSTFDINAGYLKYMPLPDENGVGYTSFQFRVNDGTDYSTATYTMTIDVTPVNSEPSFTSGGNITQNEDVGAYTFSNWATAIDPGAPDEGGQTLTFNLTNDNNALFSVQPAVDPSTGDLTFTTAANANGVANVTIWLTDDGGTANGGDDTSPSINFTITITAVNDPPTGADNTVTLYENSNITFATGHFGYADVEGDAFDHIEVTTAPGLGTLWIDSDGDGTVNGAEVALNSSEVVSTFEINAGHLKYMPLPDENGVGYTSFQFRVNDGTDYSTATYTMTIDVTPVNSEPSFTSGGNITQNEDVGAYTFSNWATAIDPGAPDEGGQTLTFNLTNDNNTLFSVQPAVDPSTGDLTFTTAANANGVANVTIWLTDDGGTANGGDDTSPSINFTITITAVNDPPTGADNTVTFPENLFYTFAQGDFGYNDIDGDAFSQLEITTVPALGFLWVDTDGDGTMNGGESPLAAGNIVTIADINANHLRYSPNPDENGTPYTNFDFRVYDGTAFSTVSNTITINVTAVNSEPSFTKGADQVINEDAGAQTVNAWAVNIDDGDVEVVQTLTFHLSNDNAALFTVQPSVDPASGDLTYTPLANAFGVANVDIYLTDDGGTANGGDDTSPVQSFTITINAVNDAPVLVNNNVLTVNEGDINQIISNALLQVTDVDNTTAEIVYTVTILPAHGTLYVSGVPVAANGTFTQAQIDANAITYSNNGDENAADSFTFQVSDGAGGSIPATVFNINVNPVNDDPVFTSSPVTTGAETVPYTYNITTTDADGDPLVISVVSIPAWLNLVDNGNGTATLSGTPPSGAALNNLITISVSDGIASAVNQTWNLVITSGVTANAGVDDTTCVNNQYTLNGNQPPSGYTGTWSIISGGGSFADPTLYNTLVTGLNSGLAPANSNTFRWTLSNSDGSYVVWDDVVIINNTVVSSVTDINNVCGSNVTLQADNALFPGESGLWTIEGSPSPVPVIANPNNRTTAVSGLNFNTNQFRWTVTKETCSDYAIMNVDVIEVYATAGAPAEICSEPFVVQGNDPALLGGTGVWTVGAGGGAFANANAPTTTVTGSNQDVVNTYIWTVTVNGCSAQASVDVQNNIPTTATITTPNPSTSCDGTYTISATPADATDPNENGYWTTATAGVLISNANNATTGVTNLQEGANLFTWHITNGTCPESTADLTINYFYPPTVDAGPDATICVNDYSLAGTPLESGETGVWTFTTGSGNIINPNSNTTLVTNLQRGINVLQWTVSHDICSSDDIVTVNNMSVDAVIATTDPLISCTDPSPLITANNPATQDIANPATAANGFWTVQSGGANVDAPLSWNTTVSNLDPGANNFIWTISNGICIDSDTITVINSIPTPADAGKDTILCSTFLPNLHGSNYDATREIGFWRVIAGGATITDVSLANSSVSNLDYNCTPWTPDWYSGVNAVNVFEWVIRRGTCESTDQVRVLNGLPEAPDAGVDTTVCATVVNLDALDEASCTQDHWWEQLPDVGTFYDPETGAVIPDNATDMPFNTHVEPIQNGMTQFVWHKRNNFTDSQGNPITCELTDTVEITSLGLYEDVQAGTNDAVCPNYYTLNGTDPDTLFSSPPYIAYTTGEWTTIFGNGNFDNPSVHNTTVRNMAAYTNIYRWTITNHDDNCLMSDDVYIYSGRPSNANAGPDQEICVDHTVLSANVPARYTDASWSVLTGGGHIVGNSCTFFACDALAQDLTSGLNTFLWTVTNQYDGPYGGYTAGSPLICTLTDTLNVTYSGIVADAGADKYMCADTAQLSANVPVGSTGIWFGGSGTFVSSGTNTSTLANDIVRGLSTGRNTFTWTLTRGICSNSDNIVVWNLLPPTPNADINQTICDDSTSLNANNVTGHWYFEDPAPPNTLWQEGYYSGHWSAWPTGVVTFENTSLTNTFVTGIPQQNEVSFIWHSVHDFTDYVAGVTKQCELTDTMTVFNNSVVAEAGSDGFVCGVEGPGATYTLGATQVNSPMSGFWSPVINPGPSVIVTPTAYNSLVTGMQNGDHIYSWNVSATHNGKTCSASDQAVVQVRIPTTSVVALPKTYEICEDYTTLQANIPIMGTGTWTEIPVPSGTIANASSNVTNVTGIGLGTRQFVWTISNDGCKSRDTITVYNNMILADADDRIGQDAILHSIADNDSAVCQDWYVLSATDPNIYNTGTAPFPTGQWTVFPGTVTFDNPTEYNTTVRNLNNVGTKISNLRWTITKGGCSEISTLDITNNEFIIDADVNTNPNILETCDGDIILAAEQPGGVGNASGYWTIFSGGGSIQNATLYNTIVTGIPKPNSVFQWNVTRFGCNATDLVQVDNNTVTSNAGSDFSVCQDFTNLNGGQPAVGETGQWFTTFGGGSVTTPTLYNSGVTNMAQGTNRFRWHIVKGNCSADDEVEITNNEPDDFNIEADKEVCGINSTISVNPAPPIGTGVWTINAGGAFTAITTPSAINTAVTDLQPGNNEFVWTVTNALCSKSDNIVLTNNMVVAEAGLPQFVCTDSVDLQAADPVLNFPYQGTGTWTVITGSGNVDNPTLFNSRVHNLTQGLNTFRWNMSLGGCTDSDDANVTNNSVQANASNQVICNNSTVFDGNNPGAADGLWTLVGSSGSPSITTPTLNISSVTSLGTGVNTFRWIVSNSAGCKDSIDITIDNGEFSISAGPDQALCSTTTILGGENPGLGYSGNWTVIAGGAAVTIPTLYNSPVTGLTPGDNVFYWTVTDLTRGCTSIDSVKIINNLPTIATIVTPISTNREVCSNSTAIEGTNPVFGAGVWSVSTSPTGTYFTNSLNYQTTVNNLYPGNNVLTWTISNGTCSSQDQITIINNEVTSVAGSDQILCSDNTTLNATDPSVIYPNQGTGIWTNTTGNTAVIINQSLTNTGITALPIGTTTFTWTVSKGICSEADDVLITNNSVTAVATDISECDGDFILTGNNPSTFGGTGYWEVVAGAGTITAPSTQYNTSITGVPNGSTTTLRWNVDNGTCTDNTMITVTNNNFSISAGANTAICGNTAIMNADAATPGTGFWTLVAGSGVFDNSLSETTTVSGINQGTNTYRWTVTKNGCTNFSDVDITNNSPSTAQITGPVMTETCDGTVTLTANNPAPYYADNQYWSIVSGGGTFVNASTSFTMNVTGLAPGNNIFKWTIERGICSPSEDQITIINNEVTSVAGSDATICTDNTFLNATDPSVIYPNQGTGGWTNLSGNGAIIVNSLLQNTQVTGLPNGTTTLQWTVTQGSCTAVSQVQIINNSVTASATDLSECDGNFTLTGNDPSTFGGTGYWEIIGGSGTITAPSTQYNTTITGVLIGSTTTLRWTVDNGTCNDNTTITVTNNNFSVSAGANQTICGSTATMNADDPLSGTGYWTLLAGSGVFDNSTSQTSTVSVINQGSNTYRWTVTKNGCTNFSDVDITNNSPSTAQITGPVMTETCDGTVTLTANNPAPYYADNQYWSIISGGGTFVNASTSFTMNVTGMAPGNNIFKWTIERGICPPSEDQITIVNNEVTSVAGSDATICTDNTFLNATDPSVIYPNQGTGEWTNLSGNGALIVNSLLSNTQVTNLPNGTTTFQWTVTQGSCTAVSQVQISNNSVTAAATDLSECDGNFTLTGNDPSTFGGTGYWEVVAGAGTITAPSTQYNTTITGVPNGSTTTLRWNVDNGTCNDNTTITVTNNNFSISAGANTVICGNTVTMNADAAAPGTGYWALIAGSGVFDNSLSETANVSGIGQGTNTYRWTVTRNACTSTSDVDITNNSPSTAQITGPVNTETCDGTATLTANMPAPYYADNQYWSIVSGGGTFVNASTSFTMNVTGLAPGNNIFKWTVERGSCLPSEDQITIINNEVTAVAGSDATICTDNTFLNATDPSVIYPNQGTGSWTNLSGNGAIIINSLLPNTQVTGLPNGTTTFQWTVTQGSCSEPSLVQITNSSVTASATDLSECDGDFTLTGNDPSTFGGAGYWEIVAGGGTITAPSTQYNTTITGVPNGSTTTLRWNVDNSTCTDNTTIIVTNNNFDLSAGPDVSQCSDTYTFNADNPSPGTGYWTLIGGNGIISNSTQYDAVVSGLSQGNNIFRWTVSKGICTNYDDITIENTNPDVAVITAPGPANREICTNSVVVQGNIPSFGSGMWSVNSGNGNFANPSNYQTLITGIDPGANIFTWTLSNGTCSSSADITIINNMVAADAGPSQLLCVDTTSLNATPATAMYPFQGTGYWTYMGAAPSVIVVNSLSETTSVLGLPNGNNTFRWTVTNGSCSNFDDVIINNRSVNATATDAQTCDGNIILTGNNPAPGENGVWNTFTGTVTFDDITLYNTAAHNLAEGNNTFVWTISNGDCTDDENINVSYVNPVASAGAVQNLCNDFTFMGANNPAPGSGVWSIITGSGAFTNLSNNGSYVSGIGQGTNVYRWTVTEAGCLNYDDVTIINNLPTVNAGPDQSTCVDNVTLSGNAPGTGESGIWTQTGGIPAVITNSTLPNTTITGMSNGASIFTWTVSNAFCSAEEQVTVTYNEVIADAGADMSTCNGTASLMAVDPSPGTGYWEAIGAGTFSNISMFNSNVSGLANGPNTLRWHQSYAGCSDYDDVVVTNNEVFVNAGLDQDLCTDNTILVGNNPGTGTGVWTRSGGGGTVTIPSFYNSSVTGLSKGVNIFTWTVTAGPCSNSDEVIINNNQITDVNAGVDRSICGTSADLAALAPHTGETGVWSVAGGTATFGNPSQYNTVVNGLVQGDNRLVWTLSNGTCSAPDTVVITNLSPTVALVSPDVEICSSVYTLVGNLPGVGETGLWTKEFGAAATIADATSNITTAFNIGAGSNTFRWTISNSVCSTYDDIVINNNTISTDAGLDASLCADTAVLSADNPAPGTGIWALVNSAGTPVFDNASIYNTVVRNLASGSNIFKWTATKGGCSAWDVVTISNDVPTPPNAGADQIVCDGTVVLSGNNPSVGEGVWSRLGGAGTIANPSHYNTQVTGLGSGGNTFRWEITQGMCSDYDDVLIMNELVFASAGMDDEICGTDYPVLNGNQPGAGETGIWTVTGGSGIFANNTVYNTSVSGLSGGENRLTWTVTRGTCSNSDDVSIYDNTPSPATVSSNQEICLDYTVISGNPPTTGSGEWSVAAGSGIFDNSVGNTTTVRNIGPDINQYRWTITNGTCTSSAVVTVTNNSVFAVVGDSINVCGTTAYLNGNEPTAGQNGVWTVAAGTGILTNSVLYNTEVTNLNKGENKFRWTISNGTCSDYADLVVTNNLYDATASVAGPTVICVDSADLLGNIPVQGSTGMWSIWAGGGYFDNPSSPTARVKGLLRGDNTLRWTVTKEGCSNYDDVVITNNMVQALAGADKITCGTDANLVANELYPGENGVWSLISGSGNILTPSSNETVITGQGAGVNVFRWTVTGNGCTDQDEVQVSENSFVTSAGFNDDVCDTTVTLQAQDPSPGTGIWSFSGPGVVIVTPTSNTTVVNGLQDNSPHTFRWTVYKNGCYAWDEVIITNNLVHAHAGGDQFVCNSQATLSAEEPVAGTGVWTISAGAGTIANDTYYGTSVTGLVKGTNTLTWTVTNLTCTDVDNVVITNNEVTATAGANKAICQDFTNLSGDQPQSGGYGVWETAGGPGVVQTPSAFNSAVTNLQRGVNTFRWTVYENGCDNGGDLVQILNNDFDAYAGEDEILPPLTTATNFNATLPAGATGQWSILSGSGNIANLTNPTSYVDNMPTGVNQFTWTVLKTNGCSDSDDVALTVANFVPFAGNDQIVCTDTAKLNAHSELGASSQTWSIVSGGGNFDDIHDPKTVVRGISKGSNVYRWTVSYTGYSAYDDVIISNDSIFVDAGDDATLCYRSHQMNAQHLNGASELWTVVGLGGGTIVNNSLWNTVVNDLEPGTNYFEWYVDNGNCISRDTVAITYNLPPIARFETDPTTFCAPDSVTIHNTSDYYPGLTQPDEFRWRVEDNYIGTTYNVGDDVTHYFTNTGTLDSTFNIILVAIDYDTQCTDTFTSTVTAYAVPKVEFRIGGSHVRRIPNAIFTFENRSAVNLDSYYWDFGWNGNNRFDTNFVGSFDFTYTDPGTYVITLDGTSAGQCDGVYRDTVVVLPPCPFSYDDGSLIAKGCQDLSVDFDDKVYYADSVLWKFYDIYDDNYSDTSSRENNPQFTYDEPGEYHPTIIAWNAACGTQSNPFYTRTDTVIVYPRPVVDFDVSPRLVMLPEQLLSCYNYSDYGTRYLWDFGDESTIDSNPEIADENPQHQYTEAGVYDITLNVWSEHDCFDSKTIRDAIIVKGEGQIEFPDAFTPDPNGPNGGVYPCTPDKYLVDRDHPNDVFYPKAYGVVDYQLDIYNRWGEKIFTSYELCKGWDGYVNGVLAPQDVYTWRVAVIYKNGHPEKKYGSVTLLR